MRLTRLLRSPPGEVPAQERYTVLGRTTDYWDFGVTREITVPSPDQILGADEQGK
jgi:hypothetical protein